MAVGYLSASTRRLVYIALGLPRLGQISLVRRRLSTQLGRVVLGEGAHSRQ